VASLGTSFVLVVAPTTLAVSTQLGRRQVIGAMTLVLEKGADGWKIVNEHYGWKHQYTEFAYIK